MTSSDAIALVSALAAVASTLVTILMWRQSRVSQRDKLAAEMRATRADARADQLVELFGARELRERAVTMHDVASDWSARERNKASRAWVADFKKKLEDVQRHHATNVVVDLDELSTVEREHARWGIEAGELYEDPSGGIMVRPIPSFGGIFAGN